MTPAGKVTLFPLSTAFTDTKSITTGPDGNLWFTEQRANQVGRITPAGNVTEFPIPTADSFLGDIAIGADGNL
jgi:virginiamycin B lyase